MSALRRPFTSWRSRPPALTFELAAIDVAVADRADLPLWALLVRGSVLIPLLALLAALGLVFALAWPMLRILLFMSNPASLLGSKAGSGGLLAGDVMRLLVPFGVGIFLGHRWRSRQLARTTVVWRLADHHGNQAVARIALPQSHGFDVQLGDTLELWGKRHHDGTLRTFHARDRRNGLVIQPHFVPTPTWVLLAITVVGLISLL